MLYLKSNFQMHWRQHVKRWWLVFSFDFATSQRSQDLMLAIRGLHIFAACQNGTERGNKFIQNITKAQLISPCETIFRGINKHYESPLSFPTESSPHIATRVGRLGRRWLCKYASEVGCSWGQKTENSVIKTLHIFCHRNFSDKGYANMHQKWNAVEVKSVKKSCVTKMFHNFYHSLL